METLYDLLGALPRDEADELRAAFRRAVKGVHPDLHPGDPLAARKFREIVRANEILGDGEQRAAYDHLLNLAHKEKKQQATAKTMHKIATSVIALVIVAGAGAGGFLLSQEMSMLSGRLKHFADATTASPADFAGLTPAHAKAQQAAAPEANITVGEARTEAAAPEAEADATAPVTPPEAKVQIASTEPPAAAQTEKTEASAPSESILLAAAAPRAESGKAAQAPAGPPLEIAPHDAKVFRERGIVAYRSGDFYGAIADFDRAIQIDPKFSAAYVDRGIVLYRMQQFERAFADIAHAKRIEKNKRLAKGAQPDAKKKGPATASLGFPPFFQRRTAKLEDR